MLHSIYRVCVCVCKRRAGDVSNYEHEVCDWKGKKATTEEALGLCEAGDECLEENEEPFSCFDELFCTTGCLTDRIFKRNQ